MLFNVTLNKICTVYPVKCHIYKSALSSNLKWTSSLLRMVAAAGSSRALKSAVSQHSLAQMLARLTTKGW